MRWSTIFLLVLALGFAGVSWQPPDAGAAVVCQRKNKVRLRAERCKEKETRLFDTAEVGVERGRVDGLDGRLDGQASQLDEQQGQLDEQQASIDDHEQRLADTEIAVSHDCVGDPARRVLPLAIEGGSDLARCRTLDADPEACGQSFQFHAGGATACAHVQGNCIACEPAFHAAGICENTCQPFSCADAARTVGLVTCTEVPTQNECEQSWTASFGFRTAERVAQATPCYWNAIAANCNACTPTAISEGVCQNTCLAAEQFPPCRAAGKTFGDCDELDGNEAACLATYGLSSDHGTQTCWYDAGECDPCRPDHEHDGKCTNDC